MIPIKIPRHVPHPRTQFLGGVPSDVRGAILANALVCFRLGEEAAALIGRRFEPYANQYQFTDLDNFVASCGRRSAASACLHSRKRDLHASFAASFWAQMLM